jgi:hypothetical protein
MVKKLSRIKALKTRKKEDAFVCFQKKCEGFKTTISSFIEQPGHYLVQLWIFGGSRKLDMESENSNMSSTALKAGTVFHKEQENTFQFSVSSLVEQPGHYFVHSWIFGGSKRFDVEARSVNLFSEATSARKNKGKKVQMQETNAIVILIRLVFIWSIHGFSGV